MTNCIINAKNDYDIYKKENIFEAYVDEELVAKGYLYPFFNAVLNPDHPFNVFIDVACEDFKNNQSVLAQLFETLFTTATELVQTSGQKRSRIYHSSKVSELEKLNWFQQMGLTHNESTFLMMYHLKNTIIHQKENSTTKLSFKEIKRSDSQYIQAFLEGYHQAFSEKKTTEWYLKILQKSNAKAVSAFINDTMVAGILTYHLEGAEIGFIEALFVDPHFKSMQIGYRLLNHIHQDFINQGLKIAQLEVWGPNKHARSFYEKVGYKYVKETAYSVGISITNTSS
ncbi:MAG: GNAT family N-acetyltransferase [Clostridiales bacterium]|nr:GNAT family N-acetyltransferase [Clostridiales bacterium]